MSEWSLGAPWHRTARQLTAEEKVMPGGFSTVSAWEKSGNWRYRVSFSGKIILQIEETQKTGWVDGISTKWNGANTRWRDAKQTDMELQPATTVNFT